MCTFAKIIDGSAALSWSCQSLPRQSWQAILRESKYKSPVITWICRLLFKRLFKFYFWDYKTNTSFPPSIALIALVKIKLGSSQNQSRDRGHLDHLDKQGGGKESYSSCYYRESWWFSLGRMRNKRDQHYPVFDLENGRIDLPFWLKYGKKSEFQYGTWKIRVIGYQLDHQVRRYIVLAEWTKDGGILFIFKNYFLRMDVLP